MGAHPEHYTFSSGKLRLKATPVNLDNSKEAPSSSAADKNISILPLLLPCGYRKPLQEMKPD